MNELSIYVVFCRGFEFILFSKLNQSVELPPIQTFSSHPLPPPYSRILSLSDTRKMGAGGSEEGIFRGAIWKAPRQLGNIVCKIISSQGSFEKPTQNCLRLRKLLHLVSGFYCSRDEGKEVEKNVYFS